MALFNRQFSQRPDSAVEKIIENYIKNYYVLGNGFVIDRTLFNQDLFKKIGFQIPLPKIKKYGHQRKIPRFC